AYQFLRLAEPPHGSAHQHLAASRRAHNHIAIQVRWKHAWRDGVHANTIRRPLTSEAPGQGHDGSLGGGVCRYLVKSRERTQRGDVDDPPAAARLQRLVKA